MHILTNHTNTSTSLSQILHALNEKGQQEQKNPYENVINNNKKIVNQNQNHSLKC